MVHRYEFASDNTAGLAPEALQALARANDGFCSSYGDDGHSHASAEAFAEVLGRPCAVYFVSTGTAANSMALAHICRSHHSVICHQDAHIETDECGAPGFFNSGAKLSTSPGHDAKLSPEAVSRLATRGRDVHSPRTHVLSLTLPTERGTVYSLEELAQLREVARENKLLIHLDGARFSNAVASLGCSAGDIIAASGADVLCFGGTKGGLSLSEAVVFFDLELAREFDYLCKQSGQLASKMRLLSAPWEPMLRHNHWLRLAHGANAAAQVLAQAFRGLGFEPLYPVQANAVFVQLPAPVADSLRHSGWHFYDFDGASRFMCSYAITEPMIDDLARDLRVALSQHTALR